MEIIVKDSLKGGSETNWSQVRSPTQTLSVHWPPSVRKRGGGNNFLCIQKKTTTLYHSDFRFSTLQKP